MKRAESSFIFKSEVRSGTFGESRVDQDLLQLDFSLPGHPQSRHVETFVITEMIFCLLTVNPEQQHRVKEPSTLRGLMLFRHFSPAADMRRITERHLTELSVIGFLQTVNIWLYRKQRSAVSPNFASVQTQISQLLDGLSWNVPQSMINTN